MSSVVSCLLLSFVGTVLGFTSVRLVPARSSSIPLITKFTKTSPTKLDSASNSVDISGFGKGFFKGTVAAPYLQKHGLKADAVELGEWTINGDADKMAAAVLDWARDNGASSFTHWFQPMAAAGVRHGQTGQVHNKMLEFDANGDAKWDFNGKMLLRGETDGSSFPNGGLRATHRAGAYLTVDPSSPLFIIEDSVYIPSVMVSYDGYALDEKTPLLRATDALSTEGSRLLNLLGFPVKSLQVNIGLEQELFFIPRKSYLTRPDLQLAGRTLVGRMAARGQEMSDHYMAAPSEASPAIAAMREIQEKCWKLGIPLRTRHREVAPNQYEFAPLFGSVTTQIDQNLLVMQIIEEVAVNYGLAALFHEKPFQGVNGSGKHNNWSVATNDGTNLFNFEQLSKNSGSEEIFPVVMAAVVAAVDKYGDLLRMSTAVPGNDFRLGACEAPPAIISTYFGEDLTNFLKNYADNKPGAYKPVTKVIMPGPKKLAGIPTPAQDRNRSSPFPYGGNRFEFRAVGSSQNPSSVNTVLAAILAKSFKDMADDIEKGRTGKQVAQDMLKKHMKSVFNGNGYDKENQAMLTEMGLWRLDSTVDAICRMTEPKNVALFEELGVLSEVECQARQNVLLNEYIGVVEIESNCIVDLTHQYVLPAVEQVYDFEADVLVHINEELEVVKKLQKDIHHETDLKTKAKLSRELRLGAMLKLREKIDAAEEITPQDVWPLASYKELLFLDQHVK